MDELPLEWKAHIKSIVIKNMHTSLEILASEYIPDFIFDHAIQGLRNGIVFLVSSKKEDK